MGVTDPYAPAYSGTEKFTGFKPQLQPFIIPRGPLTLEQAIETALTNNPEISARKWDLSAALARRDMAFSARLPSVEITGSYTHHLDSQRLISAGRDGDPGLFGRDILSGDIVVSMPLFTGGRLVTLVNAADLQRLATEHALSRSKEELIFNISSLFYNILAQKHVIESLNFSRKTLMEHISHIESLIEARKAANVDRLRSEVRLSDIEQLIVKEKNLQSIQYRALRNLLGLGDIKDLSIQGELKTMEVQGIPELETALSVARNNRGDYLAARSSLEALAKKVDISRSGRLPTLSLHGSYGERMAIGPTTGSGEEQGDVGRIGLMLNVPVFEGGRLNADISEQISNLAASQERLRSLEQRINLEVETAILNLESLSARAAAIQKSIVHARESLRIEKQKYNLGKGAILDVLDSQNALLDSETTYYRVLAEYHTAVAQLKLAMGTK